VRQLKIKRFSAENFLCFGPEGIEIDLTTHGNIVLIRGENMDAADATEEERKSSNGVGKSSIPEIITYALYGQTIKNPKKLSHNNVINNQTGKKLKVAIELDDLRIVRTRKPESLRVWESADGIWGKYVICPTTQEKIEVKGKDAGTATNSVTAKMT
jgi:hypothetical protein